MRRQLLLLSIAASMSHAAILPSDSFLDDAADLMQEENDDSSDLASPAIEDGIIPLEAPEEMELLELDQDATFDVLEDEDEDEEDEEDVDEENNVDPAAAEDEEDEQSYEMPDFKNKDEFDFDRPRIQQPDEEDEMLVPEGVEEIVDQNNNDNNRNIDNSNVNNNPPYWIHDSTTVDPGDFYDDGILAYGHQANAHNRYYWYWRIFLLVALVILVIKLARRRNGKVSVCCETKELKQADLAR